MEFFRENKLHIQYSINYHIRMYQALQVFLLGLGLFALIWFIWRKASTQKSHPLPVWLSWMVAMDNPFTKINRAATIIEHLDLKPGLCVADIGCGPGRNTIPLAKAVGPDGKVSAIDIQRGMLDQVELKATQSDLHNIDLIQTAMGEEELPHMHYDRVLMVTVIGEIPEQHSAIQEIHRSLKPEGILSITEVIFDPHFQSRGKIRRLLSDNGFEEIAFFGGPLAYTINFQKILKPTHQPTAAR